MTRSLATPILTIIEHFNTGTKYRHILLDIVKFFNGVETVNFEPRNMPLLIVDPLTLLAHFTLQFYPMPKKCFTDTVKICYTLCLVKHMVLESSKFSSDKIYQWRKKLDFSEAFDASNFNHFIGLIIR